MKTQLNKGQMLLTLGCLFGLTNAADAAESMKEMEVVVTATRTSVSLSAALADEQALRQIQRLQQNYVLGGHQPLKPDANGKQT